MKDLLLLSFDYAPNDGGIARFCSEITAGCIRAGVAVHVIAPVPRKGMVCPPSLATETRVRYPRPWRELDMYRALRTRLTGGPIVCGLWYPECLLAQAAGAGPRVVLAHGSELMPSNARWRRGVWRWMLRYACENAQLVVANSEYTRKLVLEKAPGAKVVGIPLAVDHVRFSPGDRDAAKRRYGVTNRVVISTVARLHAYKGHDLVLRSMAACDEHVRQKMTYLIAGKGPHKQKLEQQVKNLGLTQQVRFLGFVSDNALPDLYRASDLFLLCTRESAEHQEVEGFGLAFLEAQACGTPVIGTRTGGIPDAIKEGEGGWLVEQDDATAVSRHLSRLMDEPDIYKTAGTRARKRVEQECTWDRYVERFLSALESLSVPPRRGI